MKSHFFTSRSALLTARPPVRRVAGFTLIELMVTLAIGVLLMVVAAPSFVQVRRNGQLADAVNSFVMAAGSAKSASLKSGRDSYIVPNDTSLGWRSGWLVFTDNNWNQQYDAGTDEVILQREPLISDIAVTTPGSTILSAGYMRFNATGFPKSKTNGIGNGRLVMETTGRSSSIVVDSIGRVRSCKTGSPGCTET